MYRKQSGQACANSSCLSTLCFSNWEPQWRARWCCCTSPRSTEPPSCSVSICHICSLVLDTWHMYCPETAHKCADSRFPSLVGLTPITLWVFWGWMVGRSSLGALSHCVHKESCGETFLEVTLLTRGASGSEATLSAGCMAQGISQQTISWPYSLVHYAPRFVWLQAQKSGLEWYSACRMSSCTPSDKEDWGSHVGPSQSSLLMITKTW